MKNKKMFEKEKEKLKEKIQTNNIVDINISSDLNELIMSFVKRKIFK